MAIRDFENGDDAGKKPMPPALENLELGVSTVPGAMSFSDWAYSSDSRGKKTQPVGSYGKYEVGRDRTAPDTAELWKMRRHDGQASAMLKLLSLPIRGALAKGRWIAPDGEDPESPEVEFANNCWNLPFSAGGMSIPKSKFLRQTLLSLMYGFSAFEKVFYVPDTGPNKGKQVLRKMVYHDPRTVTFLSDENGGFGGHRQRAQFGERAIDVKLPVEKSYYFAANEEESPFYGVSYFEPAFQHYEMKKRMYYMAHLGAQFSAVPGRLGFYPAGASRAQLNAFRNAIANFTSNASMLVPPNFEVKPFSAESGFDFLKYIDHHNMQMTASILAKFLQQDDRQVLIDNGSGDASADMFIQMLVALADEISESWSNHIMPQLIDFNFNNPIYPRFEFAPITDDQRESLMNVFTTLTGKAGSATSPDFNLEIEQRVAGQFNLDIDYDKVKEELAAQQESEQQVKQAQDEATIEGSKRAVKDAKNPPAPVAPAAGKVIAKSGGKPAAPKPASVKLALEEAETLDDMVVVLAGLANISQQVIDGTTEVPDVTEPVEDSGDI